MTLPRILARSEHPISRGYIDPDALRILYRLHRSGYKGYLVGGSVRDLMMGRTPKDFDVGTDARPHEIRRLFRNSRVIGRRFRLAHVFFDGGKIVEVSTFRRRPEPVTVEPGAEGSEDLLIREDNTFGSPEEDALRRDFTINGLFYDIASFAVLDYVGGVADLERRLVRTIGDPETRFREDPVRMLRACEFAARLGFEMTGDLLAAVEDAKGEIRKSAAPRVTEELLDPLRRGWGAPTYRLWSSTGLLGVLLPELQARVERASEPVGAEVFWRMLAEADRRRTEGEILPEPALLGILFLPMVLTAIRQASGGAARMDPGRLLAVLEDVVNPIAVRLSLPNHSTHMVKQGLYTMGRLAETRPGDPRSRRVVGKAYFPVALTLLSLYAAASGRYQGAADAWEEVVARAGPRQRHAGEAHPAAPFPEALVPPPALFARAELPPPSGTASRRRRSRPRRRKASGHANP
ncbi:polynucleotide adenylyltransferase PcnB [Acidobacteria bacterium ACD]|nr:MAG: polynucleotide adenylyltransferase PcnB [Acidobacteriota bacterium]MCE7958925.1 polynucleotide adenylyltransferase PcnB [Acidobacteria bacterium ACB2]MDL1950599.1 polynucleotide adenylyltransferase PcnB [Acidobacteria bacterium ACD]